MRDTRRRWALAALFGVVLLVTVLAVVALDGDDGVPPSTGGVEEPGELFDDLDDLGHKRRHGPALIPHTITPHTITPRTTLRTVPRITVSATPSATPRASSSPAVVRPPVVRRSSAPASRPRVRIR